jgi:hypothetical protein
MSRRVPIVQRAFRLASACGLVLALVAALAPPGSRAQAGGPSGPLARSAPWRGPAPRVADRDMFALRYRLLCADPGRPSALPSSCEACIAAAVDAGAGRAAAAAACRRACGLP